MYAQNRKWTTGMPRVIIGGQCVLSLCKVSMSFEVQGHSCLQFSVYDVTPNSPLLQHAFELKNEKNHVDWGCTNVNAIFLKSESLLVC